MELPVEKFKGVLEKSIAFVERSGLEVVELRRGHVKCRIPFEGNVNHVGTMYAGALFTVAEIPGGALYMSSFDVKRFVPIVTSMKIDFLRMAKTDVVATASLSEEEIERIEREAAENGKAPFRLEAELTDTSGEVVARSIGDYQLRLRR